LFNLDTSFSIIILVLDLFGTVVFAATGALRAIEHKYDIVGIIILATVTGIFGGVMRDTILGIFPPNNFSDTIHIVMTTITAIIIFLLYHRTKKYENLFNIFDAVGLGVFTFTGASIAYSLFSSNMVLIVISGLITAFWRRNSKRRICKRTSDCFHQRSVCGSQLHRRYYIPYISKHKTAI
jgi:Predicted membrane protein